MDNWIIPCNPKFYDVTKHFQNKRTIIWRNSSCITIGDTVYIYIGIPYSEIKYRCIVINDKVSDEVLNENRYAIPKGSLERYKYIEMELEFAYPHGTFAYKDLKQHGLTQVQKQARIYRELALYLVNTEADIQMGR